ncbi:MAG TPA: cellulase family glycosylhydrolase [Rugosimonospora sp.]|nr:cellulase family glycosylhydrolase [Rugosimonospora sp.]
MAPAPNAAAGSRKPGRSVRLAALLALALAAGTAAAAPAAAAPPPGTPVPDRIASTGNTFFDTVTHLEFLPRGANYVRLAGPAGAPWHSTFEPGLYDSAGAGRMLNFLKTASGYNTVRVFVDSGGTGLGHGIGANPVGPGGLRAAYLDGLADFVSQAAANGIYVMLSADSVPFNRYYDDWVAKVPGAPFPDATDFNSYYLDPGWILAKQAYLQNLTTLLESRLGAYRTAILAYETDNEVFFHTDELPFSQGAGRYTLHATGDTYDMGTPAGRQNLLQDGLAKYANAAVQAVHAADAQALVTVGLGTNFAVGKAGQTGLPVRCDAGPSCPTVPLYKYWYPGDPVTVAAKSAIDFVDMHVYPQGGGYSIAADLASSGVPNLSKPFMLGELGADKTVYPDIRVAAVDMRTKQVQSCAVGRGAKGWLFFTYDSDIVVPNLGNQGRYYSLLDPDGSGIINGALAPVRNPSPCG